MNDEQFLSMIETWLASAEAHKAKNGASLVFTGTAYVRRLFEMASSAK